MEKRSLVITSIAVILSFVGGFLLANAFNRGELIALRAENERLRSNEQRTAEQSLSTEEIDGKLAEAERNAGNFQYQKNLGLALYRYGAIRQDPEIVAKALPVLERAATLESEDQEVLIGLGNAHFDLGYYKKENESFERARKYYRQALESKSDDPDVRADLGLTYFLQSPPDLDAAVKEFRRTLQFAPGHEKALQFLIQALVRQGKHEDAAEFLEKLKAANPASPSINELSSLIQRAGPQASN